jgi:predicted GNAT superfamily acetyltransferase
VYEITLASSADVDGITVLLEANSPSHGGSLTGEFPRDKVAKMALHDGPVMVAHRDGQVVGVLFSSVTNNPASPPVVQAMLTAWPGRPDAYTYGPVCIADSERGQGLLAKLYAALQRHYPDQEAILFIRRDNAASLRAHERLGMHEVAGFVFDSVDYAIFSDRD